MRTFLPEVSETLAFASVCACGVHGFVVNSRSTASGGPDVSSSTSQCLPVAVARWRAVVPTPTFAFTAPGGDASKISLAWPLTGWNMGVGLRWNGDGRNGSNVSYNCNVIILQKLKPPKVCEFSPHVCLISSGNHRPIPVEG